MLPLLSEEYQVSPLTLLPRLTTASEYLGEAIHASSGLIHVALMLYLARRATWTSYRSLASPLPATLIPLGLLLLARKMRPSRTTTPLQAQIEQGRDRELAWWILKGAIYERWTKPKLDGWIRWGSGDSRWKRWLGLGLVSGLLQDHQKLVEELYYCECGRAGAKGRPDLTDGSTTQTRARSNSFMYFCPRSVTIVIITRFLVQKNG
jgi:peroxin-16